jgi:putative CocE/NonD family hydrolase
VLVYTSDPLASPLRIAGPLHASLVVSSSAPDTDFVARLVDVWPDGRAISIQEGALRARYRAGIDKPRLLEPDQPVSLRVDMRSIAYTLPAGHRLRLQVTSSSFPRLERNLNTGGNNADETRMVVATNRVHHGPRSSSFVELNVLPATQ